MGKHSGQADGAAGTDHGDPFGSLTAEQKGAEFDASDADPAGYAARNFGAGSSHSGQYDAAREQQRAQQDQRRGQ